MYANLSKKENVKHNWNVKEKWNVRENWNVNKKLKVKRWLIRMGWQCRYPCALAVLILVILFNVYVLYGTSILKGSPKTSSNTVPRPTYKLQYDHNVTNDGTLPNRFEVRKDRLSSICRQSKEEYGHYMGLCLNSRRIHSMYCTKTEPGIAGYLIDHNAVSILKNVLYGAMFPVKNGNNNPYLVEESDFSILLEQDTHNLPFHEFWNVQHVTKFTFVRDPYARLLSSYLDSLYISNPIQWRLLAKTIRPSDPRLCVTDITFKEYVEFYLQLIRNNNCPERLLLLNYQHADPCRVKYDYIGKFEHLERDITTIINKANMSTKFSFPHFQTDGDAMQITGMVKKVFDNLKDIKDCGMNLDGALKRLWHRLQSKGILGIYDRPPSGVRDDNQQSTIQTTVMRDYLMGNMYGREENKGNALREAYSQLPDATIAELQHVFKLEIQFFGYNVYPDYIRYAKDYMRARGRVFRFIEF